MTFRLIAGVLTVIMMLSGCQSEGTSAAAQAMDEPIFEEAVEEHKCDLLTIEDVAAATGVPASAIEEEMSGCYYSWEGGNGRPEGSLYLGSFRVHDSVERAQRTHARYTQDVTDEEVDEAKEQVQDDLEEKEASGEMSSSEESLASAMVDAMPEGDFTHRALSGVGNEAAMDNMGSAYIRVGNATIRFSGKTDSEDRIDPALASEIGKRIVANLKAL